MKFHDWLTALKSDQDVDGSIGYHAAEAPSYGQLARWLAHEMNEGDKLRTEILALCDKASELDPSFEGPTTAWITDPDVKQMIHQQLIEQASGLPVR